MLCPHVSHFFGACVLPCSFPHSPPSFFASVIPPSCISLSVPRGPRLLLYSNRAPYMAASCLLWLASSRPSPYTHHCCAASHCRTTTCCGITDGTQTSNVEMLHFQQVGPEEVLVQVFISDNQCRGLCSIIFPHCRNHCICLLFSWQYIKTLASTVTSQEKTKKMS